jgi:N-acetylglucosaminyldiphosphoundecaprenol N-acetyl-beta-D-mannosaminyltransferase
VALPPLISGHSDHPPSAPGDPRTYARDFGGIKLSAITLEEFLHLVRDRLASRTRLDITYLNPDYARRAFRDAGLRDRINRFDLVLVDGIGVKLLTPLFGFRVPMRLDTDFITPQVFALAGELDCSAFLFGSRPGTAERAAERLVAAYPHIRIAGTEHGFHDVLQGHPGRFDPEDSARIVSAMNDSGADCVLVSLPTPLQQDWLAMNRASIAASVVMTGGSYIDHMAASERWPASWYPEWTTRLGLNWLYRLVREPGRLWKRYSIEFLDYLGVAVRTRLSTNRSQRG